MNLEDVLADLVHDYVYVEDDYVIDLEYDQEKNEWSLPKDPEDEPLFVKLEVQLCNETVVVQAEGKTKEIIVAALNLVGSDHYLEQIYEGLADL